MVFNIFFLTITISKRHLSKADIDRADRTQRIEELIEKNKERYLTIQRYI